MAAHIVTLVPGLAPAAPIMRLLSRFDREKIEAFAEISIALLDLQDGDPDLEVTDAEDDFLTLPAEVDFGPGCPLADAAEVDDEPEDDDPAGQCDEDGVNTAHGGLAGWSGPGCPLGDGEVALP